MAISGLAEKLLESHAREPGKLFYNIWILGGFVTDDGEHAVDQAYLELEKCGFMESGRNFITFFGTPKTLYRVTSSGLLYLSRLAGV